MSPPGLLLVWELHPGRASADPPPAAVGALSTHRKRPPGPPGVLVFPRRLAPARSPGNTGRGRSPDDWPP
eukprot:12972470-Alexandrium_andersonii.AAC.1